MAVEGQVIAEEVDVGADQLRHPAVVDSGQAARHPVPEETVVDEDGVGPGLPRADEELLAGGDPGHHLADLRLALDLEPVGAEVTALGGFEILVEVGYEAVAGEGSGHAGSLQEKEKGDPRAALFRTARESGT